MEQPNIQITPQDFVEVQSAEISRLIAENLQLKAAIKVLLKEKEKEKESDK